MTRKNDRSLRDFRVPDSVELLDADSQGVVPFNLTLG